VRSHERGSHGASLKFDQFGARGVKLSTRPELPLQTPNLSPELVPKMRGPRRFSDDPEPDIPIVAHAWLAGVQTHADTNRRTVRPVALS
jgi:hypothetical protein